MKLGDIKEGDVLVADGGFDCLKEGARCVAKSDERQRLYVECYAGRHYLDGQVDDDDQEMIVGLAAAAA